MNSTNETGPPCRDRIYIFYTVVNVIIFILGVAGNGLVIWIAGFKVKKSVVTTWYLSLAMSDFLFCFFLPFSVVYVIKNNWVFGHFMSNFVVFNMFFNWFNSIFLFVIISVDRCVVVIFPVWAHNHRTIRKACVTVMLAWIISAAYCLSSAISLDVQHDDQKTKLFFYVYQNDLQHTADVTCDFVVGFLVPFLIIVICYVFIIRKLKSSQMTRSKKPFRIMTLLITTFFICWLPYHIFAFMELTNKTHEQFFNSASTVVLTLANVSSCLNPFLYAFMGKDVKKQCYSLLLKIENAVEEEEGLYTAQGLPATNSGESKPSTTIESVQ
ncbi:C3a anaphylatoxin chemotactic receptor-like [Colossoma macropomum]|uniref:C3a anaphylatoxin chemotactic receptor-like n=1 Tax=Colossoma macropomum TaxID=42526 RepID=UPI001865354E|nr:C3a anaphylatoxin chemotactic receptor-like [Colossoma macropomum]